MGQERFQEILGRARELTAGGAVDSALNKILEALTELGEEVYPPSPVGRDVLFFGGCRTGLGGEWPMTTKIQILKAIRAYGDLSLKAAKDLVDAACVSSPSCIRCATPEDARALVAEIQESGGRAEVT